MSISSGPVRSLRRIWTCSCGTELALPPVLLDAGDAEALCPRCADIFPASAALLIEVDTSAGPPILAVPLDETGQSSAGPPSTVPPADGWDVDRDGFEETEVTLAELKQLAKLGDIRPQDRIRRAGNHDWSAAGDLEALRLSFVLHRKEIEARLMIIARTAVNRCGAHGRDRAEWVCFECGQAWCGGCAVRPEDGAVTPVCPRCQASLRNLSR